jgi:hypothetical protein
MRNTIVHAVLSVVLVAVVISPTLVPAIHAYMQEHEHNTCTAHNSFHFHDDSRDCLLCDYLISIHTYFHEDLEHIANTPVLHAISLDQISDHPTDNFNAIAVRGPPAVIPFKRY